MILGSLPMLVGRVFPIFGPAFGPFFGTVPSGGCARPASVGEDPAETYRRFQNLTRPEGRAVFPRREMLLGGVPFLGMSWEELAGIAVAAGAATLLVRGLQKYWETKTRPFGELRELNRLTFDWAVTDEEDARRLAANLGAAFVNAIREKTNAYHQEYFQAPYTVPPQEWGRIGEIRNRLTGRYLRSVLGAFRDCARGLSILTRKDWGSVYAETFDDFMGKVFLVAGPMTRWQDPPTPEDQHNFEQFELVLRRELGRLEAKIGTAPARQAV